MEELVKSLSEYQRGGAGSLVLEDAAVKWAGHCLMTYKDDLLRRALDISAAIANFVAELGEPK